jgi:hypothetical protein
MTVENKKDKLIHRPVQKEASLTLILWGFLLKTPKSNAKKISIPKRNRPQTIMLFKNNFAKINIW